MSYDAAFPNLDIYITNLPRKLFTLLGFDIYIYGVLISLAIMAGYYIAMKEVKRTNQDPNLYIDFLLITAPISIISARLYYVIFSWDSYKYDLTKVFAIREGGLAIYGGIIAAIITAIIYTRLKKVSFIKFAETCIPSLALGQAIGRWGNFFNREAYGGYCTNMFALRYRANQAGTLTNELRQNLIYENGVAYIQVHPTFLYESFSCLIIFTALFFIRRKFNTSGHILFLYFIMYGIVRYAIESIRTDQLLISNLAISKYVSLLLLLMGIIGLVICCAKRRPKSN